MRETANPVIKCDNNKRSKHCVNFNNKISLRRIKADASEKYQMKKAEKTGE